MRAPKPCAASRLGGPGRRIAGDPAAVAEAVAALSAALAGLAPGVSPLDSAHAGHALGLALQAMGEACDEDILFDRAVEAFSPGPGSARPDARPCRSARWLRTTAPPASPAGPSAGAT